jgi:predicted DNA-binding transcriptional regulator AlpA
MAELLLRYRQLEERGYASSRTQLANLIRERKFPAGRLLSPNCRVWLESEIDEWLESRPVDPDEATRDRKQRAIDKANAKLEAKRQELKAKAGTAPREGA